MRVVTFTLLSLVLFGCGGSSGPSATPAAEEAVKLEPTTHSIQVNIVDKYCVSCHNAQTAARGVNLSDMQAVLDGKMVSPKPATPPAPGSHQHGPPIVIVKGCLRSSLFYSEISQHKMPPPKPGAHVITAEELQAVAKWIESAAPVCGPDTDDPDPDGELDPGAGHGGRK